MIKKRNAGKLALHTESVRELTPGQMESAGGGASKYTRGSCSSQTWEYTCCVVEPPSQWDGCAPTLMDC